MASSSHGPQAAERTGSAWPPLHWGGGSVAVQRLQRNAGSDAGHGHEVCETTASRLCSPMVSADTGICTDKYTLVNKSILQITALYFPIQQHQESLSCDCLILGSRKPVYVRKTGKGLLPAASRLALKAAHNISNLLSDIEHHNFFKGTILKV